MLTMGLPNKGSADDAAIRRRLMSTPELAVLRLPGPPVRPSDLARLTGLSLRFIQQEIAEGTVKAVNAGGAECVRATWLIPRPEAVRWLIALGLLPTN